MSEFADYPTYGDLEDAYYRHGLELEAEHAEHKREVKREQRECRTDWKPAPRATRTAAARLYPPILSWKLTILDRDQGCCVHANPSECRDGWQAHHVVPQQVLRRDRRAELIWNPLGGMGVCGLAHRQHHNRSRPIRLAEIPAPVAAFLRAEGYGRYLERFYDLDWYAGEEDGR